MTTLKLAVPSKGRLKEQTEDFFRAAGVPIEPLGGARGYLARIPALPDIEVRLLSASEIAAGVIAGDIHVGVSGEDLLREQAGDLERVAHLLAPLGFGRADLVHHGPDVRRGDPDFRERRRRRERRERRRRPRRVLASQ